MNRGVSSPWKKEVSGGSPQKTFQGSPRKTERPLSTGQRPKKCYHCECWGHGWQECPTPENLNWKELVGAAVPPSPTSPGSTPIQTSSQNPCFTNFKTE